MRTDGDVKHIPTEYLLASVEQRRELLRGLLDTDGTVASSGAVEFATSNPVLSADVKRLVATLGYIPYVRTKTPSYSHNGESKQGKLAYTISFQAHPEDRLFNLDRKNDLHRARFTGEAFAHSYADAHLIVDIKEVEPVPMRCISVDSPSRQFLVSDSMIPTHNSVLQRNLVFHCIQHNDMWRFLGVDVKRVELTPFKRYSKTVLGIGANLEDGVEIVRYAKEVMETRYEEMENKGVNHFKDLKDENGKPPYAVMLMVDEAFMFLSPEGAKTDEGKMRDQLHGEASVMIGEIARLGRASGVHLVLATQRPDATVIRGELKANLDIRIAAGRLDATPSSMVLDSGAATQLPGHIKGRGIVRFGGEQEQFQGYYADQDWIEEWLAAHPGVEPDLYPVIEGGSASSLSLDDELEALSEGYDFENGTVEVDGEKVSDSISDDELAIQEAIVEAPLGAPGVLPEIAVPAPVQKEPEVVAAAEELDDLLSGLGEEEVMAPPPAKKADPKLPTQVVSKPEAEPKEELDEAALAAEALLAQFYGETPVPAPKPTTAKAPTPEPEAPVAPVAPAVAAPEPAPEVVAEPTKLQPPKQLAVPPRAALPTPPAPLKLPSLPNAKLPPFPKLPPKA